MKSNCNSVITIIPKKMYQLNKLETLYLVRNDRNMTAKSHRYNCHLTDILGITIILQFIEE